MSRTTFSLVGAGRMGQNHLRAALQLGYELQSIFDLNLQSLQAISNEFELESTKLTDNFQEFLALPSSDITVIATTSPSHADIIEQLVINNRKILVSEKPLANSLAEINKINQLVNDHGITLAVNHQMRFMDQYRLVKKYQSDYSLGRLTTMTVNGANFGLGMNATHYIEAFHWLTDSELFNVSGNVKKQVVPNVRGKNFFDYAGYMLGVGNNGSILFLDFQEDLSHHVLVVYNFEFGKITVNELVGKLTIDCRMESDHSEPTYRYGMPNQHIELDIPPAELVNSTSELYENTLTKGSFPNNVSGEKTVRAALAVLRSTELGGIPVSLNDPSLESLEKLSWP